VNTDGSGSSRVADEVVAEIEREGGSAVANYDSVATVAGGEAIVKAALDTFGALDILVNNAGILRDKTLYNMEEDDWDAVIAVHLKGHYCCTRPFVRYIRDSNRLDCRIINFSSVSGLFGNFGQSNYGAAKAGIAGFSRVIAKELAKFRCTVNTISPGAATRMTIPLAEARGEKVDASDWKRGPQQIAPVVTWLASEAAKDLTAQIVHVSRGSVAIMQQPAVIRAFKSEAPWTLAQLDQCMPKLLEAKQTNDERAKKDGAAEIV
jgi:NAD(P)-dependent dehydrogenase (short-subunit alcohol dehydrogenase family)